MSKKDYDDMIVKYTLMPYNEEEDYEHFFSLSLRELAKATKDKMLMAPFIIYNSELDVPMDNDLEDYTVYCNKSQIHEVIKKQEIEDVFRTLVIHGFEVSLDEMKEFISIARRNYADLCINIIQDTGIDSNITLYIDADVENSEGDLWKAQKKEMEDEISDFIENYDSYDVYDYTPEEIESVENFLESLFGECGFSMPEPKKKSTSKKSDKSETTKIIPLMPNKVEEPEDEEIDEDVIAYSFELNDDTVKMSCIDGELFIIEENDYEVALNQAQMDFVIECYYKMMDYIKDNKPRK